LAIVDTVSAAMPTTFVKGDLFRRSDLKAIAHGCNCAGAMGKGIAVEFRRRFPKMYAEYRRRCAEGLFTLGDVFAWTESKTTVFNLGTQKTWRSKAQLSAIEKAVHEMVRLAAEQGLTKIGLPRIGAGLGGLAWEDVRALLEEIGREAEVELVVFEEYQAEDAR
jgi:O-acetyl-ADP-ribose deacetylase (regulator of RNase III)